MGCTCMTVCISCASDLKKCENCSYKIIRDIRFINFHRRIARKIDRPCKNVLDGCTYVIKPGDMHEINCQYEPVACDRCQDNVIKERMQDHFNSVHCLGNKNYDVKFADFYLESTGSRKIKCVTNRGLIVYFILMNVNSVQFNTFAVLYPETELNVNVKLDFIKQGYKMSYSDNKLPSYLDIDPNTLSIVNIEENILNDWVNGECKLDIEVAVRKKRQIQGQQEETVAKKAKAVKIGNIKKELGKK